MRSLYFLKLVPKNATEKKTMDLDLKASDLLADLFYGVADDDGELQAMLAAPCRLPESPW